MKKQLIALLTLAMSAVATTAPAALIDVVSFNYSNGLPPEYLDFLLNKRQLVFFDEARSGPYEVFGETYPAGWVSQFGALDGGEFFFTDLFSEPPDSSAEVSWNFAGSDYYSLRYITAFGREADGTPWTNLYRVPFAFRFEDLDSVQLNPEARGNIIGIAFYGLDSRNVPDSGSTVVLLGLSVLILGAARKLA